MIDDIYSNSLTLAPNTPQVHSFPGVSKLVFLENKSYEPISVYWKLESGDFNDDPVVLNRKQSHALKVKTDAIRVESKSKAYLEVLTVVGDLEETKGGFYAIFTHEATSPFILKELYKSAFIRSVCVKITQVFDPGFSLRVGFPADPDEIILSGQANCQKAAMYEFYPFRVSEESETLQIEFIGSSSQGAGIIFVEE